MVSPVGERALAAVRCADRVDVYHAQWAGSNDLLARVFDSRVEAVDVLAGVDWTHRGRYDPAAFPPVDALGVEAVYLLSAGGVRVYLPVWPGFSWPGDGVAGLLVRVGTLRACRRLRWLVRFLKGLYHEAIARGHIDARTARRLLVLGLRSDCAPGQVHPPDTPL